MKKRLLFKGKGICYIRFRVGKVFENIKLIVKCGEDIIVTKDKPIMLPAEMETLVLDKSKVTGDITIEVKEDK